MSNYTAEDLQKQLKPLSENAFVRFFQKIWRWWLGVWYGFADKHEKLAPWIYKIVFFFIFSMGVTIWQLLVMLFLPYAFASLTATFAWPGIQIGDMTWLQPILNDDGSLTGEYTIEAACFSIFGDTEGLGKWIAFEIATFTAQCINFPLQRNITYKSHGNPWYQAMWYFVGWVGVSFFTGAVWGIIDPFLKSWGWYYVLNDAGKLVENGFLYFVATLLKTIITGGVSMVIFFFIFLIIFPDNNKVAKNAKAKYDKLVAGGADSEKIAKAERKYKEAERKAELSNAEKEASQAKSQFNSKAMRYFSLVNASEKADDSEKADFKVKLEAAFNDATAALETKLEKEAAFADVKAKNSAA